MCSVTETLSECIGNTFIWHVVNEYATENGGCSTGGLPLSVLVN